MIDFFFSEPSDEYNYTQHWNEVQRSTSDSWCKYPENHNNNVWIRSKIIFLNWKRFWKKKGKLKVIVQVRLFVFKLYWNSCFHIICIILKIVFARMNSKTKSRAIKQTEILNCRKNLLSRTAHTNSLNTRIYPCRNDTRLI